MPQYGRPPVEYMVLRVQVKFVHSLLRCGWLWVGHNLCLLMFALSLVDFLSLLLSPSTDINIFYFCQKYHLKDTYKIFHVDLKFVWGLLDQYWLSCERHPLEVFFSCLCDSLLRVTCWWPLSGHWSVQLISPHLSGFVLYGGLKA